MNKITTKKIIEYKKSKTKHLIIKELKQRFSPRFFKTGQINDRILNSMFEAARWAPSAYNFQPWYFYTAKSGTTTYKKIFSCLSERNQWAKTAPMFIVACYLKERENNINKYAQYDLGLSVMSMVIQAQSFGIYSRQMGLFDAEKLQKSLSIPETYAPFVVIAIGKLGDYSKIDKELLEKELHTRERKISILRKGR